MIKWLVVILASVFPEVANAQSPPTATEAFNLRIQCKKMSDQKAQEMMETNIMLQWEYIGTSNTSKYDPASNRCYGRIYAHIVKRNFHLDHEYDQLYDLQIDDLLGWASIENGKKHGSISDENYKKPWAPSCARGCPRIGAIRRGKLPRTT
jgi:hypothetical protein